MCFIILRKSEFAYSFISGHCTEYSSNGNLIQSNRNTNCMNFSSKPCPIAYKSTEAYKCMLDCFLYNASKCILLGHLEIYKSVFLPHLLSILLSLGLCLSPPKKNVVIFFLNLYNTTVNVLGYRLILLLR